jgi:hypothetical protein
MTPQGIETYLSRLGLELRRLGIVDARIVEEARDHLTDALNQGVQSGMSPDVAEQNAIARFGPAKEVAVTFAGERYHLLNRVLFLFAVLAGVSIAYVDSRPHWDDAGITAFSMLVAAGVCGLIGPMRPWLWALAVGIWIPVHTLVRTGSPQSLIMLILLAFPFAGAYAGMAIRRGLAMI